jgi:hypothetical protein
MADVRVRWHPRDHCLMWCYLETWIVGDGQLPDISTGTVLTNIGVSILGNLQTGDEPETVAPQIALIEQCSDSVKAFLYRVSGVAGPARDVGRMMTATEMINPKHMYAEFLLTCGPLLFKAQASGIRSNQMPDNGIVSLDGTFSVMDEFDAEDAEVEIRRSWTVVGIQVQRYEVIWSDVALHDRVVWEGDIGHPLDLVQMDRIDATLDQRTYATERVPGSDRSTDFIYILDLEPAA